MSLKTDLARRNIPALYSTDGTNDNPMDNIAQARIFGPGRYTYYVTEWDGKDLLFGYVLSPLGSDCDEWGYTSLSEFEATTANNPFYLFEVERSFSPCALNAALALDAKNGLADCGRYEQVSPNQITASL
jgi:hypothetical protein